MKSILGVIAVFVVQVSCKAPSEKDEHLGLREELKGEFFINNVSDSPTTPYRLKASKVRKIKDENASSSDLILMQRVLAKDFSTIFEQAQKLEDNKCRFLWRR